MDIDTFWDIIDTARASAGPDKPFHEALVDHPATRTRQDNLQYQERFDEVHAALLRLSRTGRSALPADAETGHRQ